MILIEQNKNSSVPPKYSQIHYQEQISFLRMENKLIYIIAREIYIALATTILGKVVSLSLPINKKLQVMDNKQACSNHCFKGHSA